MRRVASHPVTAATLAVTLAIGLLADRPAGSPPQSGRPADKSAQPGGPTGSAPQRWLGFDQGATRRYALGPPEALVDGESAAWSIALHHIEGEGPDAVAVFDLDYTRREPYGPLREPRVTRSLWAELTINAAGFPLRVVVGERVESGEISTEYVYAEGGYRKAVRWPETELEVSLRIPRHDQGDAPAGVFAFLTRLSDRRVSGGRPFADSVFANPGLLSLVLPNPLPAGDWQRDVVFLTPGERLVRYPTQDWIRLQRSAPVLRSHFDTNELELGGVEEVVIGGEPVLARRFDLEGPFRGGYLDARGRVLLLRHDPGGGMERPVHIRMLSPAEY
jgi:hypothetical protein